MFSWKKLTGNEAKLEKKNILRNDLFLIMSSRKMSNIVLRYDNIYIFLRYGEYQYFKLFLTIYLINNTMIFFGFLCQK